LSRIAKHNSGGADYGDDDDCTSSSPLGDPDAVLPILASGSITQDEFTISRIEMRLYTDEKKRDPVRGPYSVITTYVRTDRGSIEMVYDKGFRGPDPLESAARLVSESLGPAALVQRSVISLRGSTGADPAGAAGRTVFVE